MSALPHSGSTCNGPRSIHVPVVPGPYPILLLVPDPYLILLPQKRQKIVRVGRQCSDKDVPDGLAELLIHGSLTGRSGNDGNDSLATQGVG